jgi:branched-chain amino acid transport system substrate-binding protein
MHRLARLTRTGIAAALLSTVVLAAACGGAAPAKTANGGGPAGGQAKAGSTSPIVIGWSMSLTGSSADMGDAAKKGTELAVQDYKKAGGKYAKRIQVIYTDDQTQPTPGVQNVTRLIKENHAVAIMSGVNSGNVFAEKPVVEGAHVPFLDPVATAAVLPFLKDGKTADPWFFRLSQGDEFQVPILMQAIQKAGLKKIAILYDTTGYGQFGHDVVMKLAPKYGVSVVAQQTFKLGDTDMTAQMGKAKAAGAQAVITYTLGPELAHLLISADTIGWHPPIYGSWTLSEPVVAQLAGLNILDKFHIFFPQDFAPNMDPQAAAFVKKFQDVYGTGPVMWTVAAQCYEATRILLRAIDQAGPNPAKIRDALQNMTGYKPAVLPFIKSSPWTKTDHEAIHQNDLFLATYQHGNIVKVQ